MICVVIIPRASNSDESFPEPFPELEGSVFKDPTATKAALKFSNKVLQSGLPRRLFKKQEQMHKNRNI